MRKTNIDEGIQRKPGRRREPLLRKRILLPLLLAASLLFTACSGVEVTISAGGITISAGGIALPAETVELDSLPAYSGEPFVAIHDNQPAFDPSELTEESFESYSELDELGRCGVAVANIGIDLMPTEERKSIGQVKPSGWQTAKYDFVEGKYLYNRCHLIGFQLTGENANAGNLITGTRYLNVDGMLPFENMVADYIKETGNHVLYRVTPVFEGDNLVANGVLMEAESVEDGGEGIRFCVYCYNVQPNVDIDYATGESTAAKSAGTQQEKGRKYVLNTGSKKFHLPDCSGVEKIKEENRKNYTGKRQALIDQGYAPCGICKP